MTEGFLALEAEIETLAITNKITLDNVIPILSNDLTSKSYVDNLLFKPVISCRPLTNQTIIQHATLNWGDILYNDTNSAFVSSTGTFTAQIAGVYHFSLRRLKNKTATSAVLRINDFPNGNLINALDYPKNLNTGYATLQINLTIPMNVGNSIFPTVETAYNVLINNGQFFSFSGIFIRSL
jgi:hypothetical protein